MGVHGWVTVFLLTMVVVFITAYTWDFNRYLDAHHCHVASSKSQSALIGGKVLMTHETCWTCDPGPRGVEICQ